MLIVQLDNLISDKVVLINKESYLGYSTLLPRHQFFSVIMFLFVFILYQQYQSGGMIVLNLCFFFVISSSSILVIYISNVIGWCRNVLIIMGLFSSSEWIRSLENKTKNRRKIRRFHTSENYSWWMNH